MTTDKLRSVLEFYRDHLCASNDPAIVSMATGYELSGQVTKPPESNKALYLLWMCLTAIDYIKKDEVDKAHRWLGFVQGAFWCEKIFTIDQMRTHSRSEK